MSKRRAGNELTHDNWDQEEEQKEEAGVFQTADKTTLAKRPIKKAKRRFPGGESQDSDSSASPFGAFKGFSGFGAAAATTTKKPDLTFGSQDNKPKVALTPAESTAPVISSFVVKSSPQSLSTSTQSSKSLNGNGPSSATSVFQADMNPEYSSQLRSLNQSVSSWIQQHVNANPLCDLTPVFEDYKKHLKEIESKKSQKEKTESKGSGDASSAKATTASMSSTTETMSATATTASVSLATKTSSAPTEPSFSFFKSSTASSTTTGSFTTSQTGFSFKPTTVPSSSGFSSLSSGFSFSKKSETSSEAPAAGAVGQVKPFAFGVAQPASSSSAAAKQGDGDEDEPPKVEFKEVKEKDAIYSQRCKLFYKKDDAYKDRGVGVLHLKKVGETGQMLLRADTNLGNVILNVGIYKQMPAKRQGKNNVFIMAAMNPPVNEKCPKCNKKYPAPQESNKCESGCAPDVEPLLLRVKTGEDADQLLEEINKLKG